MKQFEPTFLGKVASDWRTMHLKRIGKLKGGAGFPHDDQGVADAEIPFYKVKHLQSSRYLNECDNFVSRETADRLGAEIMQPDTIVFAKVGAALLLNRFRILTRPSCIDNNMTALAFDHRCERDFLFYLLNQIEFSELFNQGPVPSVNSKQAGYITIPLPPLPEQKRIAAYLDASCAAIDRAVATKQKQLETLDALRKSIIQRAVTQGLNPKVKMKASGVDYLGEVPTHWRASKMKRLLSEPLSYGLNESGTDDNPGNPRYIRITDFGRDGVLRDETFRSLPPDVAAAAPLQEGDILLARSGATVGKSFLFSNFKGVACYAGYLIKARSATHLLLPKYLYLYTRSLSYEAWKDQIFSQATIQNISAVKYAYLEIPVPPTAEQEEILKFLDSEIEKTADLEKLIQSQISTLTAYRKSLIHECVTGKRRITDADVIKVEAHV